MGLQPRAVLLALLVALPTPAGQQALVCVSDHPVVVVPWFEVPAAVCVCAFDYPAVVGPSFAAAVVADEFAALAFHFLL